MATEGAPEPKAAGLESILRRERTIVLVALAGVTALAWAYLIHMALDMSPAGIEGDAMAVMRPRSWDTAYFFAMFLMWAVMMAGMMLPSATPVILLHAAIERRRRPDHAVYRGTAFFAAGYLAVWSAFSLLATLAQWRLNEAALLSPMMASTSAVLTGLLFLAAAVYQLTPLKHACLAHCRSPVEFLARHRRTDGLGALRMGLEHGAYCAGCCWVLMALLFAVGVMNLLWVAAIAVFVLAEKILPAGPLVGRLGGVLMAAIGVALLAVGG